jgi:hypothetical protein
MTMTMTKGIFAYPHKCVVLERTARFLLQPFNLRV